MLAGLLGTALSGSADGASAAQVLPKSVIGVVGDFDTDTNRGIGLLVSGT